MSGAGAWRRAVRALVAACTALAGASGVWAAEPLRLTGRAMGTTWTVTCEVTPAMPRAEVLQEKIAARLEELEAIFSTYRATSELARFNATPDAGWVGVSAELAQVATESGAVHVLTRGAFDPTVAPLLTLWGFGPNGAAERWPDEREIARARARVGYAKLQVRTQPPALRKTDAALAVDFSSMAKGFAADEVSVLLVRLGAAEHLVQLAGDMKSAGARPWRVGVETAGEGGGAVVAIMELKDGAALSTSGNYRNAIVREGRTVGHIVDPRSGRPADSPLAAVSVVASTCARSSALATGLFVLGADAGWALAEEERLAALFQVRGSDGAVRRETAAFRLWRR